MSALKPDGVPGPHRDRHEAAHDVPRAVEELRRGRMIIVTDDANREGEGDILLAAIHATASDVNLMAREARGLICCAIDARTAERLDLGVQVDEKRKPLHGTAFTESVDWNRGTTTGISAADRAAALRGLADEKAGRKTLRGPGTSSRSSRAREASSSAGGTRRRRWISAASPAFHRRAPSARS